MIKSRDAVMTLVNIALMLTGLQVRHVSYCTHNADLDHPIPLSNSSSPPGKEIRSLSVIDINCIAHAVLASFLLTRCIIPNLDGQAQGHTKHCRGVASVRLRVA